MRVENETEAEAGNGRMRDENETEAGNGRMIVE